MRAGWGRLLELMTNIFHQRGLGDFDEWPLLRFEPTGKVQQVVGVDAQRAKRELPDALTVQESVRPGQFLSTLFVKDTIRGSTGRSGTVQDNGKLHCGPRQKDCSNCWMLSRPEGRCRELLQRGGGE